MRRVKNAVGVARRVLENTEHTMLAGELATQFAVEMGFKEETLSTDSSIQKWKDWKTKKCQPNYRSNVTPDPTKNCGPYTPIIPHQASTANVEDDSPLKITETNHDTIGMICMNRDGRIAAGTSTNGLIHKVPGRVGDSPVAGAGAYADDTVGAAVATGDGDVMMRFLPTYQIVEFMRHGMSPQEAADESLKRIRKYYPKFMGATVALSNTGEVGASCAGFSNFRYCVRTEKSEGTQIIDVPCK